MPSPVRGNGRLTLATDGQDITAGLPGAAAAAAAVFKVADAGPSDDTLPYMDPIRPLLNVSVPTDYYTVLNSAAGFRSSGRPRGSWI